MSTCFLQPFPCKAFLALAQKPGLVITRKGISIARHKGKTGVVFQWWSEHQKHLRALLEPSHLQVPELLICQAWRFSLCKELWIRTLPFGKQSSQRKAGLLFLAIDCQRGVKPQRNCGDTVEIGHSQILGIRVDSSSGFWNVPFLNHGCLLLISKSFPSITSWDDFGVFCSRKQCGKSSPGPYAINSIHFLPTPPPPLHSHQIHIFHQNWTATVYRGLLRRL